MPELIYLDQLHWIGLSKARLGQEAGAYAEALVELRAAVASGRAVVPLSSTHYMETSKIASAKRRADLAITMGDLSRYIVLTTREVMLSYELRRALAQELGVTYRSPQPSATGYGFAHAFGKQPIVGSIRGDQAAIEDWANNNVQDIIARLEEFAGYGWRFVPSGNSSTRLDLVNEAFNSYTQFWMLKGPDDKREPELLKLGFNPSSSYEVMDAIARREADLARLLAEQPTNRQGLDDIIAVRALYWDLNGDWNRASSDVWTRRVVTMEEFGKDRLNRVLSNIPIVDIESSIRQANFRNSSKGWESNDMYDLDYLGTAVTYCDVVVTEKHLHAQLSQQDVGRRYGTAIFRRPQELTAHLRRKPST